MPGRLRVSARMRRWLVPGPASAAVLLAVSGRVLLQRQRHHATSVSSDVVLPGPKRVSCRMSRRHLLHRQRPRPRVSMSLVRVGLVLSRRYHRRQLHGGLPLHGQRRRRERTLGTLSRRALLPGGRARADAVSERHLAYDERRRLRCRLSRVSCRAALSRW